MKTEENHHLFPTTMAGNLRSATRQRSSAMPTLDRRSFRHALWAGLARCLALAALISPGSSLAASTVVAWGLVPSVPFGPDQCRSYCRAPWRRSCFEVRRDRGSMGGAIGRPSQCAHRLEQCCESSWWQLPFPRLVCGWDTLRLGFTAQPNQHSGRLDQYRVNCRK